MKVEIINKLKDTMQEDKDIQYLLKADSLYYICKAYLEVMWDFEFKNKKSKSVLSNVVKDLF